MNRPSLERWMPALLLIVVFSLCPSAQARPRQEHQFIWQEANTRMASARTKKQFLDAGSVYGQLVRNGVRNGPLFYNLGLALLQAEQYDEALRAFTRAERYQGSTPEIRRNLRLAILRDKTDQAATLPWSRYILFWHYASSVYARMTILVWAFCLFWVSRILYLLRAHRIATPLMIASIVAFILYGSSVAATFQQENKEQTWMLLKNIEMGDHP